MQPQTRRHNVLRLPCGRVTSRSKHSNTAIQPGNHFLRIGNVYIFVPDISLKYTNLRRVKTMDQYVIIFLPCQLIHLYIYLLIQAPAIHFISFQSSSKASS